VLAVYFWDNPGTLVVRGRDHLAGLAVYCLLSLSTALMAESMHRSRRHVEETRERLRVTLSSIADAVVASDATGRITSLNAAAERLTGWMEHEALGRPLDEVVRVRRDAVEEPISAPFRKSLNVPTPLELKTRSTLIRRDGTELPIEDSAAPIRNETGETTGRVLTFRDVSEQRRTEDILISSAERLRLVLREMPICLLATDAQGKIIVWNSECERVTGFAANEILGNAHALELLYPDRDYREQMIQQWRERGHRYRNWEWRIAHRDGSIRTVAWSDISEQFAVPGWAHWQIGVDITVRKRAEETLRASEQRFRTMADSAPVMIWVSDMRMHWTWFNQPWLAFTGRSMEQEQGFGWVDSIHPEDTERCVRTFKAAFASRQPYRMEYRLRRHDGQYRWVLDQGVPLESPDGAATDDATLSGYVGSAIDIHEKTEATAALREADRRKNEFLAMLAHELRNPLATIQYANYVSRLQRDEPRDESLSEMIENQVKHLARLIDDLLEVSRITQDKVELQRRPIDPAVSIRRAIEACRPVIEARRHRLHVEIPDAPLCLLADATRLEQIVQNLVNNAAKYTPEEGTIDVTVSAGEDTMRLTVRDNGVGMPRELIPQVFELFTQGERTLDRSEGGLGIGLTLVRKLVEMHGGTVTADSDGPGHGSRFCVCLPLAPAEQRMIKTEAGGLPAAAAALRILIVEDNIDSARGMGVLLKHAGHQVELCHHGDQAVEAARLMDPDVVLLDIGLPGKDGYAIARELREDASLADLSIIALSGYGQRRDRERTQSAGFDHHLVKPIDFAELLALLAEVNPKQGQSAT